MKNLFIAATVAARRVCTTLNGCAVTSGQSSVGQYVDDATVTTRVKTRFAEDTNVSAMRIHGRDAQRHRAAGRLRDHAGREGQGRANSRVPCPT